MTFDLCVEKPHRKQNKNSKNNNGKDRNPDTTRVAQGREYGVNVMEKRGVVQPWE